MKNKSFKHNVMIFSLILGTIGLILAITGFVIGKTNKPEDLERIFLNMNIADIFAKSGFIVIFTFLFLAFVVSHLPQKESKEPLK